MPSPGSRKTLRWLLTLLVLLLIGALAWHFWPGKPTGSPAKTASGAAAGRDKSTPRPGFGNSSAPTPVRVASASLGDFPLYYKALGTVTATNPGQLPTRTIKRLLRTARGRPTKS